MAYASKSGRAATSANNPSAFAVCDRCSIWYNRNHLQWQYDYRGAALANTRLLVCNTCADIPQNQLRAIVVPADPVPIIQPRVEPFVDDETGQTPVYGVPTGLDPNAVMPQGISATGASTAYRQAVPVLSVTGNGSTTVAVTCSRAHGLSTDDQIVTEGLASRLACGFFSITVTSATAFTYVTGTAVPIGSLWGATSSMFTARVGLPYSVTQIPQV